jgi:Sulfotransferase domain
MHGRMISGLVKMRRWLLKSEKPELPKPYPIYPDDVFFVSYPRSGSAWLRPLIAAALDPHCSGDVRRNFNAVIPDMYGAGPRLAQHSRPRMIKSHEPYQALYPKVVYLYRDGRDVAVSYHNFYRTVKGYPSTFDEFLELFVRGQVNFGKWDAHVCSWLFRDCSVPLLAVAYEDLHRNTATTVGRVLKFLGHSISDEAIQQAIAECTFARRQEHVKHSSPHYSAGYRGGVAGKAGSWRETLTSQQAAMLWATMGSTLKRLGYQE